MPGFMRQRGSSWELRVYLGRDAVTTKKRWATRTVKGTKRQAEKTLASMVTDAERGSLARTGATVGELLERWFDQAKADFSPKTVLETRGFLDRNLLPALGHVALSKLRGDDLDRLYAALRTRKPRPLAPGTIRRIHGIVRRALGQGVRWGWIAVNPALAASPPRVPLPEISPPSPSDVARLFALAQEADPDLATFVVLAAATGARRSELLSLRWSDVDLEVGSLRIGRGLVMGPAGLVEKSTKTHSVRTVALDATTAELLRDHHARASERINLCGSTLIPKALVFSGEVDGSEPWRPDSTSRAFRQLCAKAGLKDVRLHDLRHYVATRLLASGVDVRTVAGRLGHRDAATTLNVYSHFLPEADRKAADVLGSLFDEAVAAGRADPKP